MKKVTVLHLLSHHASLPANIAPLSSAWLKLADQKTPSEQRRQALKYYFSEKPPYPPGSKFLYSNLGYIITGAVIEKLTGLSWEDAVQADLQAVGHEECRLRRDRHARPTRPTVGSTPKAASRWPGWSGRRQSADPRFQAAASIARFRIGPSSWPTNSAGAARPARVLKAATYQVLHTPPFGHDYALGWGVTKRPWGGGTVWNHEGDNTMNHANVRVAPKARFRRLDLRQPGRQHGPRGYRQSGRRLIELHNAKNK